MSLKIVYFTRSGNSERVAEKIGEQLLIKPIQISDDKNWKGILGYIRAGYYSMAHKEVKINVNGNIEEDDEIILVAPMWAGDIASAARMFIKDHNHSKLSLVITSMGSMLKKYSELTVYNIIKNKHNEDEIIQSIVDNVKKTD